MDDIVLTRTLLSQGYNPQELARMLRDGTLTRIRRGAYVRLVDQDGAESNNAQYRRLILSTVPQLDPQAVVSHGSAAVLHGLPTWTEATARVHVTRNRHGGARRRALVEVHGAPLDAADLTLIDGLTVTSLNRTVLDLARTLPWEQAVAAGDRALGLGLTRGELTTGLQRMRGWPGTRSARRAVAFLDGRSESAGESVSRVRIHEAGLPAPVPQLKIFDSSGRFVARVDFGWEEERTIGEFDGKAKYSELLKPGQTPRDAMLAEKRREDLLRDLGWQVVRWTWADLYRSGVIRDRVLRAFARGA
jgi:hypothetical protein